MKNAYEFREEFTSDGKRPVRREHVIGPVIPWAIVVIVALLLGKAYVVLPSSLTSLLKW